MLKPLPGAGNTAEEVGIRAHRGVDFAVPLTFGSRGPRYGPSPSPSGLADEVSRGLDQDVACGKLRRLLIEAFAAV